MLFRSGEDFWQTAIREVAEETGLDATRHRLEDWNLEYEFEIFERWRARYGPGVTHNVEHVFGLTLPTALPVRLAPREHLDSVWLPWEEAAEKCFSWSNEAAIRRLGDGD